MEKKMYPFGGALIAILIIAAVLMAYAPRKTPGELTLSEADSGKTIEFKTGQIVSITLEANPTTGYTWDVVEAPSVQVMRQVGEIEFEPESDLIGAGGVQTVRFEVVNPGQTSLTLAYHRPWETAMEPLNKFSISVIAR
jgi:inhibitor of cysteine peptidase